MEMHCAEKNQTRDQVPVYSNKILIVLTITAHKTPSFHISQDQSAVYVFANNRKCPQTIFVYNTIKSLTKTYTRLCIYWRINTN